MPDEVQLLIDSLRRGRYEDPTEKIGLLSAALQEARACPALLLTLLGAPQIPLRLAAIDACRERKEPELVAGLVSLVDNPESRIRVKLAQVLRAHPEAPALQALEVLLQDADDDVREAAMITSAGLPKFRSAQETALANDPDWSVRLAAVNALGAQPNPEVVKPLAEALSHDADEDVRRRCAEILEKQYAESPETTAEHLPAQIAQLASLEKALKQLGKHRFPQLIGWLAARTTASADPETLARFGTDLTALAAAGHLPHAHDAEEACDAVLKLVQREPWRSIALLGPAGVGKTALVHELVYRLAKPEHGGWRVLRVSPADFMSGTKYLGEWETKVSQLIEAIKKPRRVLLYVPNLSDLSAAGTWSKSDSSVATALAPYLEEGSVLLLGESAQEEFERGLGGISSLARLFDKVQLAEPSVERARQVLAAVRNEAKSLVSDELLDQVMELSAQFLSHISRPGNSVDLLKAAIKTETETPAARPPAFRDLLNVLSKSTGIPVDLLDDGVPLNQAATREFFERKIMGQPEAVEAVVDLVTLIKAGVTDPSKPFAVFLFVGPTGVGKTELARALAEFIFGDPSRLTRFDMSEFANTDGFTRLIGGNKETGLLTDAVRRHPFSVLLLDEIEKAHVNVFDLCLQIFDAGRLTDGRGRTVDFRRTIVILTSNVGATAISTPLGFVTPAKREAAEVDRERTFRELSRFFRPEFLNRLDRIVQFRALSLEVAEQIARREIDLVLQRSGIRRRQLVVDIDPEVVSLLVREGYSPHFGARPLKRTVERLLLLPLARAISGGSLRPRAVLRLTERNGRVETCVTSPAVQKETKVPARAQPATPLPDRLAELRDLHAQLSDALQPFVDRKTELIVRTQQPDFFRNAEVRSATLGEIHTLDQFVQLHQGVGRALAGADERLQRGALSRADESALREKLDRLAAEVDHLRFVASCHDSRDLGDALAVLSLVNRTGAAQQAAQKLASMYQALAARRRMTSEVLGELYGEKRDCVYLLIAGLGAYGLLKNEAGLHQLDRRFKERTPRAGREVIREDRELVRVEIHPAGTEPSKQLRQRLTPKIAALKPARERLLKAEFAVSVFDEQSVRSVEFWTGGPKSEAEERALLVLHACGTVGPQPAAPETIVRHYDVGMAPKVKDARTGRTTTRVDRVLHGDLDLFLSPLPPPADTPLPSTQ